MYWEKQTEKEESIIQFRKLGEKALISRQWGKDELPVLCTFLSWTYP
jgi:hypothetical protein